MILSDKDIKKAISDGSIGIRPFNKDNLTPNGYDLSIKNIYVSEKTFESAIIEPFTWFAASTVDYLTLKNVTGQLWIRSSYARKGVISSFGKVDAGFEGCLTLSCFNTHKSLELKKGERFCQIVFETLTSNPSMYYKGKYGGQTDIKLY